MNHLIETFCKNAHRVTRCIALGVAVATMALPIQAQPADGAGSYSDLKQLFDEFLEWREWPTDNGVRDYSTPLLEKRQKELMQFQARLADMGVRRWEKEEAVDYLLVRAHMDEQDFILRVTRPWARDPVSYIDAVQRIAFTELPVRGRDLVDLRAQLKSVPKSLEQAKRNLTNVAGDYADLAIFWLSNADGVGFGHPYREIPPAGTIGWYNDLSSRAGKVQPNLTRDIEAARDAVQDYHDWLVDNRSHMTDSNGVGEAALNWFLKHVKMIPYTAEEIVLLAERELQRLWAFHALERHRNRELPEIKLAKSAEDYKRRLAETDQRIRQFLVDEEFISIPDYIPTNWQEMGFNVPWIERDTPPNFWEQIQFRDPTPDHLHAVIPGHRYDARVETHLNHPIRKVSFGDRREGWALYLEEAAMQAGLLDDAARTRELIYLFGIWRAARTIGDVRNQTNEWDVSETHAFWLENTPWLDEFVARRYSYLQESPGHTLHYTMGAHQMFRLLADRKRQLGDSFVLKDFHDVFMSRGRIPIALIRYEMTGLDDDMAEFWNAVPLSKFLNKE